MREENVALMKRGYEAFAKGDLEQIRALAHDDEVWATTGMGVFKSEYRGVDEVVGYLGELARSSDGTFKDEPLAFFANDDQVVVLERVTAARKGRTLDSQFIHVYDIKDGKVSHVQEFAAEPKVSEEFWS